MGVKRGEGLHVSKERGDIKKGEWKKKGQGFPNSGKGWEKSATEGGTGIKNFTMGGFLLGEGNLRSDFEDSNLFQS